MAAKGTVARLRKNRTAALVVAAAGAACVALMGPTSLAVAQDLPDPLWEVQGHTGPVLALAYSPDGQTLVSAAVRPDHTIKLWNASDGQLLQTLVDHTDGVISVAFSPDGQTLASAGYELEIYIWRTSGGSWYLERKLDPLPWGVNSVAFSPDGQWLASAGGTGDPNVRIWRTSDWQLETMLAHTRGVNTVAFSPDGQWLASAGYITGEERIRIWRVPSWQLERRLEGHTYSVSSVAFSPDSQFLVSGAGDSTARLWRVSDGQLLCTFVHGASVIAVTFSPDGAYVATGSNDTWVRFWPTAGCQSPMACSGPAGAWVGAVAFAPAGGLFAYGRRDGWLVTIPNRLPVLEDFAHLDLPDWWDSIGNGQWIGDPNDDGIAKQIHGPADDNLSALKLLNHPFDDFMLTVRWSQDAGPTVSSGMSVLFRVGDEPGPGANVPGLGPEYVVSWCRTWAHYGHPDFFLSYQEGWNQVGPDTYYVAGGDLIASATLNENGNWFELGDWRRTRVSVAGDRIRVYVDYNSNDPNQDSESDWVKVFDVHDARLSHGSVALNDHNAQSSWDYVDIMPFYTGDLNCDGRVNFADINPFVLALGGPDGYEAAYAGCDWLNADCNADGTVNFADINPFVALLTGPGL